tara:strand:+ start:404 stop:622 length:219 start_codon:yes stop_codon:yes gene_type:complete
MEVASQDPALLAVIGGIVVIVFSFLAYGIYASFGPGSKELRDTIDEHARMHELGIAHGHSPKDKHNPARSLF